MGRSSKGVLSISARLIATCFALASFASASIVGMAVGNSATTILWRSVLVMVICWFIGWIAGGITQRTVDDHIEQYKQGNPIPRIAKESGESNSS